jgi:hypothetical protein
MTKPLQPIRHGDFGSRRFGSMALRDESIAAGTLGKVQIVVGLAY